MQRKLNLNHVVGWWNALDPRMPQSCSIDVAERHVQSTFIRWLKQNFPDVMIRSCRGFGSTPSTGASPSGEWT